MFALLYAVDALVPQDAATTSHSAPGIDKSTVRIQSAQKLPERVVFDTSLPTIVPPAPATQMAAAPLPPAPGAGSSVAQARETFAQYVPADAKKHEPQAPKRHKVARARAYQPMYAGQPMYMGQQPMFMGQRPMRVAQQSRFGFFGGGPAWGTW
ncbi:hypothetical protein OZ411_29110 [Bradyrhizobium sp. Arg237L]|uniref:hypothetical protein n=1 Tax=Bradyrhizobium sp. Arg237L TaxID=3003352 RepID=UPI00249E1733|nr:hypothetical protein [Bradyrhizobium sp. Arg237L]MDI4236876.1 hypothetical protein [Bradyrhizobium sp. Arg237L]